MEAPTPTTNEGSRGRPRARRGPLGGVDSGRGRRAARLRGALETIGVHGEQLDGLFDVLAAIMQLANVEFVHDEVTAWHGSISAEHGIGQMKRAELARLADPARLAMMRAIKQALDPQGLLNPGKLL